MCMFENSFAKYVMGRPPTSVAPLVMMRVTYDNGDFLKKKHLQTRLTIALYWGKNIKLCFVFC